MNIEERNDLAAAVAMHVGNGLEDAQMDIGGANLSRDEYIEIVAEGIFDALHAFAHGNRNVIKREDVEPNQEQARIFAEHVVHEMRNVSGIDG